jgi:hypothetical protein
VGRGEEEEEEEEEEEDETHLRDLVIIPCLGCVHHRGRVRGERGGECERLLDGRIAVDEIATFANVNGELPKPRTLIAAAPHANGDES